MSDGLKFDLTLSTSKAAKQVEKFVKDIEKRLSNVQIGGGGAGGGSGPNGPKSSEARAERLARKQYKLMQWLAKQQEKSDRDAEKAAISRGKVVERAAKERLRLEKQIARETEKEAKAAERAAIARGKVVERAARERQKQAQLEAKPGQDRDKAVEDFLHRRNVLQLQYGQRDEQLEQRHQQVLLNIQQNGHKMRLVDIQRQLQIENVMYAKSLQKKAQTKQQGTLFGVGISNKTTQSVFQVQQAIEDFGYAGMRGASNNIAMLASTMGGPGGLIALLGVTAMTIPTVVEQLGLMEEGFFDNSKALGKMTDKLKEYNEFRDAMFDDRTKNSLGRKKADLIEDVFQGREGVEHLTENLNATSEQIHLLKQYGEVLHAISGTGMADMYHMTARNAGPPDPKANERQLEELYKSKRDIREKLMSKYNVDPEDSAGIWQDIKAHFSSNVMGSVIDDLEKEKAELEAKLKIDKATTKNAEERLGYMTRILDVQKEIGRSKDRGYSPETFTGTLSKANAGEFKTMLQAIEDKREDAFDDLEDQEAIIAHHLRVAGDINRTEKDRVGALKEALRLQKEYGKAVADINAEATTSANAIINPLNERTKYLERVRDLSHETEQSLKSQLSTEKSLLKQIDARREALRKTYEQDATSHAGRKFDFQRGIARKESQIELEKFTEQNQVGLESDLERNEAIFAGPLAQMQRAAQMKKAGFNVGVDPAARSKFLNHLKERQAEQIRKFYEQRQKAGEKQSENLLQNKESAIQAKHEGLLKDRADKLGRGKSPDRNAQMDALKELYNLQAQQVSQGLTPEQMKKSEAALDQTWKDIQNLYAMMDQEEQGREQKQQEKVEALTQRLEFIEEAKKELSREELDIFSDRDVQKVQEIERVIINIGKMLEEMKKDPFAAAAIGGMPVAAVGAPASAPSVSNTQVSNTTTNNYNMSVAGIPARPSLTMGEAAGWASKQAQMRSGMA